MSRESGGDATWPAGGHAGQEPPGPVSPARWARPDLGRVTGIEWSRWIDSGTPVDPYLVWADLTAFRGLGGWQADDPLHGGRLPFLVEMAPEASLELTAAGSCDASQTGCAYGLMQIPAFYREPMQIDSPIRLASRYFTARIRPESVSECLKDRNIARLQLGVPRIPTTRSEPEARDALQAKGVRRTIIGIIDDGCAFAHPAFCAPDGSTRVHFLWDQDPRRTERPPQWSVPEGAGYGAELRHATLSAASRWAATGVGEDLAHRFVDYGPVEPDPDRPSAMFSAGRETAEVPAGAMLRSSHGAGAMYLAAGYDRAALDPVPVDAQRHGLVDAGSSIGADLDYATRWPIVFVQLPTRTILDTSGGSLGVHVLDGIRYILDRASRIPDSAGNGVAAGVAGYSAPDDGSRFPAQDPPGPPQYRDNHVVISISYGSLAGPHDGTSIIEQAMADVCRVPFNQRGRSPIDTCWICCAAGNAHGSRTHAQVGLRAGQSKSLLWRVGPDNRLESFLELWLPDVDATGSEVPDDLLDQLVVTIRPPGGQPIFHARRGEWGLLMAEGPEGRSERALAGTVFARRVVQGTRGTMILVAVTSTGASIDRLDWQPTAPHGDWVIDITRLDVAAADVGYELPIHAWVERNDLVYGGRRGQQATVLSEEPVPDPTEFMPEAQTFLAHEATWVPGQPWPNAMQPQYSLGSLAGLQSDSGAPFYQAGRTLGVENGHVVVVGAFRLSDGEVSSYSSGGPHRQQPEGPRMAEPSPSPTGQRPRDAPDVDAPADIGPATRGLRVAGLRAGDMARLSGTSAAAPTVARAIANVQFARRVLQAERGASGPEVTTKDVEAIAGRLGIHKAGPSLSDPARPTPTPLKDDRYRRGRARVR